VAHSPIIESRADGVFLTVRVVPRAARSSLAGIRDGALLVRLTSPPVEGAANEELVQLIASLLGVPRRQVSLVAGSHGRRKRLKIVGVDTAVVATALAITVS
jgi:uncharacterized protein (TIGR00251 family)